MTNSSTSNTTAPQLVLGAMMFGITIDEQTSFRILDRFVDEGGQWIDTADCYAFWASESGYGGDSERLLGRWFAARPGVRERVKISTKVGAEPLDKDNWPASREGLSAPAVASAFEGSLQRLGLDHVDLLWAHMEDRSVRIEETAEVMGALVVSGHASRLGTSNHPAWRVERARAHAIATGLEPVSAVQHSRSYLSPKPGLIPGGQNHRFALLDDELVDLATTEGLEIWAYTPLLSGAYDNPAKPFPKSHDHSDTVERLVVLDGVAADLDATRGQVVLAWLVANGVTPILGGSKVDQLDAALTGVRLELAPEHLERLGGLPPVR